MTTDERDRSLSRLVNTTITVLPGQSFPEPGQASVLILFSNQSQLRADYWRVIVKSVAGISSFDDRQQYGLPAAIDAVAELQRLLDQRAVASARLERETGDLHFNLSGDISLQVFNFTGYEIWELTFPDGAVEYSNYSK